MNKFRSIFSATLFTFVAFSSVISHHVYAKEQTVTGNSAVQENTTLTDENLIKFFAKADFKFIGDSGDMLVFSVLGRRVGIDKSAPKFIKFWDFDIKSDKGFSAEKLNKWLVEKASNIRFTPSIVILDNRLIIVYTHVSLKEASLEDIIASAMIFARHAAYVEEAKSQFEK